MTDYLRNCWYVAAWADECRANALLSRTLLDIPIVLFRDADGQARALFDRCPHRFAPLSMGQVKARAVICGYHGLGFGGDGSCRSSPG